VIANPFKSYQTKPAVSLGRFFLIRALHPTVNFSNSPLQKLPDVRYPAESTVIIVSRH
jgi:hypothetical protein